MKFPLRFFALLSVLGFLVSTNQVRSQTYTYYWKDNNNNGQWDWNNNQWWYGEGGYLVGGVNNGGGAIIYFENTGQTATTINSAGAFSGGWFKLNSIYAAANSTGRNYSVSVASGQTGIELYGKIETISGGGTLSFSNIDVQLGGNAEINAVGNTVTLGGLRMNGKTLNSYGANSLNIQGVIQGTGTYNIKNQGITVTYSGSGANTFSGTTTVENSSKLYLNKSANTAAIAGQLVINNGGTVRTDAAGQLNNQLVTVNGTLNLNNQSQSLALAGTDTAGSVSLGTATITINNSGSDSFAGVISGSGGLIKTGVGTQTFTGNNSYSGKTQINQGTLSINADARLGAAPGSAVADQLQFGGGTLAITTGFTMSSNRGITLNSGGGTIDVASGQILSFAGLITGANTFTKANSGTLTLTGNSGSSFSGTTTLSAGTIRLGHDSALGTGSVNLDGGTISSADGNARSFNNNLTIRGDVSFGEITVGTGALTFGGTVNLNSGTRSLTINQATTLSGAISSGSLTKAGSAQLTLGSDSSSFSTLTVNAGTVAINGNTTVTALAGSGTVSIASTKALTASMAADSTFSGVLSGAGGLTKTGSAILNLTGTSSSYTGTTAINGGMATISGDGSLGGTTAPLSLGGGYLGFNGTFTLNSGRATTITAASSGFDVYGSQTLTYNGAIGESGGARAFDKKGAGTLILGGNNTYTGATTVSVGVARATSNTAFGTAAGGVTVSSGAAVELSGGITIGAEALTLNGAGISDGGALRNISENNTWQGAISNNNGARINSDAGKLTVSGNITSTTQNFYVGGASDIDITGTVSGSASTGNGALYKDGAGRLTLTGNNTGLTGLVRVLGGTASIATANNIGSGTVEIGGTGTLATTADLTRTAGLTVTDASTGASIDVASGTTFTQTGAFTGAANSATKFGKSGAGTLIFNAASGSTFGGQIQIGQGSVIVGTQGALGGNTSTVNRGVDLGLNVGDTSTANDVSLLASNGVTVGQSIYVAPNTSSATRTVGISGSGTASFSNEIRLNEGTTLTVQAGSASSDRVNVSGAITQNSGTASGIIKEGQGTLALSGANAYTGTTTINAGTVKLERLSGGVGATSVSGSTIAVNSGGTLLLGAANQIGDTTGITMSGGTLNTAGNGDAVGRLILSAESTIRGLNAIGSGSAFTFSDVDLGQYTTSAGPTLNIVNSSGGFYSVGTQFLFSTSDVGGWTGRTTTTQNNFEQKIQFGNGNFGALSFSSGTGTTLTVTAIPDARVYTAAACLIVLIGVTEYRRRRRPCRR